jgi:hypothetical protein
VIGYRKIQIRIGCEPCEPFNTQMIKSEFEVQQSQHNRRGKEYRQMNICFSPFRNDALSWSDLISVTS